MSAGHFATQHDGTRVWVGPTNAQTVGYEFRLGLLEARIARALTCKTLEDAKRYLQGDCE
jgi:hypothetical protein